MAVGEQLPLSFEVAACVIQLALGGGEGGFGRTEHAELVFWIEVGQHLSRVDPGADIDRSLDHPPAETKSKRRLVVRPDVSGQHHRFGGLSSCGGHGPDGPYLGRLNFGVGLAGGQQEANTDQNKESTCRSLSFHCELLTRMAVGSVCV